MATIQSFHVYQMHLADRKEHTKGQLRMQVNTRYFNEKDEQKDVFERTHIYKYDHTTIHNDDAFALHFFFFTFNHSLFLLLFVMSQIKIN